MLKEQLSSSKFIIRSLLENQTSKTYKITTQETMLMFKNFIVDETTNVNYIADVFPEKELTLLHGQQGSGKSYSCIKALNNVGITPLYIAVEETSGLENLDKYYLSGKMLNHMMRLEDLDIQNEVIVIDTYSRLHIGLMKKFKHEQEIPELLEKMIKKYDITIIVIGHTSPFVGKDGIFRDNISLARYAAEELFLEKTEYKATQKREAHIEYNLHVNKGRGKGGAEIIPNWMR